jgi:hypothetical protein
LANFKCFQLTEKIIFITHNIVYTYHLHKQFFASLPHLVTVYRERAPYGAYLPEQVLGCPNICPTSGPTRTLSKLPLQIASNICRQLHSILTSPLKAFYSHSLSFSAAHFCSLSSFLNSSYLYENIRKDFRTSQTMKIVFHNSMHVKLMILLLLGTFLFIYI